MAKKSIHGGMTDNEIEAATAHPARPARQRTAALVLPTYSLKNIREGQSLFVKLLSEIITKPDVDQTTGEQKKDKRGEPANMHLIQVGDLDTGEIGEMVVPIIMFNAFEAAGVLQGRCFELLKGKAEANKATKWQIYEIAAE